MREEYSDTVRDLTRRFFHYLVRHHQLVKGFQLAVDINDYDLFMDIHHAAVRRNVPDLAHAALIKVNFLAEIFFVDELFQARTSYNKVNSDPVSRCTSSQSHLGLGSQFQLFANPSDAFLQPVKSATFHKTTSAKKISTNEFKHSEFDELVMSTPGKSLKYESIVTLSQQSPAEKLVSSQLPLQTEKSTNSPLQPSPYVYCHRQDDNFVTHLNTEDYVTSTWKQSTLTPIPGSTGPGQITMALSSLSVSDHSQYPEQQVSLSTFQRRGGQDSSQQPEVAYRSQHTQSYQPEGLSRHHQPQSYQVEVGNVIQQPQSYQPEVVNRPLQPKPSQPEVITGPQQFTPFKHEDVTRSQSYQKDVLSSIPQPPLYQPPPQSLRMQPHRDPAAGKEDIKVIHFGIV